MLSLTADAFLFGSEKVVSISHVPSFPAIRTTAFSERQRVAGTRSPARGPRSKCGGHWAQRWTDSAVFIRFKMGLSEEGEESVLQRFEELCMDLNMDKNAKEEALQNYHRIQTNFTLEVCSCFLIRHGRGHI